MQTRSASRVLARLSGEEPVVEDVAVAEGRALREPGGAAGVLDVDRVGGFERGRSLRQRVVAHGRRAGQQLIPVVGAEEHHLLEARQRRSHLGDHRPVVARLEVGRGHEHAAARLVQRVLHLVGAVGRVDRDEDRADLGGGVLHEHPRGAVRAPDAHSVADVEAAGQEGLGHPVDLGAELAVAESDVLERDDERVTVTVPRDGGIEVVADRPLEQRHRGVTGEVRELAHPGTSVPAKIRRQAATWRSCTRRFVAVIGISHVAWA